MKPEAPETQSAPEAQVAEVVCPCAWDDVGGDTSIGGFRDPDPNCIVCHGTGRLYPLEANPDAQ